MTVTLADADLDVIGAPACRACGAPLTRTFLDLGDMPLANSYLASPDDPDPRYPLHARVCGTCLLVQADATVDPTAIFCDYPFRSAVSRPWIAHCRGYVEMVTERFGLGEHSTVIEIASNDGTLLAQFSGPDVLGVDPARNVTRRALVPTITEFFGADLAHDMPRADLVIANNVLGHVPDLNDFVAGLSVLLKRDGVLTIEVPWLGNLIADVEFDTIYHEHFSYFSLAALTYVLERHRLRVFDVEQLDIHGGSLRVYASRGERRTSSRVHDLLLEEQGRGLHDLSSPAYTRFSAKVGERLGKLRHILESTRLMVAGAGAPAKGNTLLNALGATTDDVAFVTDTSRDKQHKFLPGSHIPIRPPVEMTDQRPEYVLVLAWNWYDEIVSSFPDWGQIYINPVAL